MNKILFVAFFGILYSCSTQITKNPEVKSEIKPLLNSENLAKGKQIYETNCGSCHKLFDKKEYNSVQWRELVNSMQKRAGIDDLQKELVYNYLAN